MFAGAVCVLAGIAALAWPQQVQPVPAGMPSTQPSASRPASPRVPDQADMYRNLLREVERPPRIQPTNPRAGATTPEADQPAGSGPQSLLLEGEMLVDRPGRLIRVNGRSMFRLNASDDEQLTRTLELNKNGLLEAMEYEAEGGAAEFHITAVVAQYRGANYLTLLKYRRQIPHGNLGP